LFGREKIGNYLRATTEKGSKADLKAAEKPKKKTSHKTAPPGPPTKEKRNQASHQERKKKRAKYRLRTEDSRVVAIQPREGNQGTR